MGIAGGTLCSVWRLFLEAYEMAKVLSLEELESPARKSSWLVCSYSMTVFVEGHSFSFFRPVSRTFPAIEKRIELGRQECNMSSLHRSVGERTPGESAGSNKTWGRPMRRPVLLPSIHTQLLMSHVWLIFYGLKFDEHVTLDHSESNRETPRILRILKFCFPITTFRCICGKGGTK